jgi:hypothetical protein
MVNPMKKLSLSIILAALVLSLSSVDSWAMMHGPGRGSGEHRPYGGYCRGPRWGWYGARRDVKNPREVRQLLSEFLKDTDLSVGEIRDKGPFFEADILEVIEGEDQKTVVDILIVDKRTCRIRSKF